MAITHLIAARCSSETKQRFRALAARQELTESALLKRWVELVVQGAESSQPKSGMSITVARHSRLSVRLRPLEQRVLKERSAARHLPPATYASLVLRAHLNKVAPIPKEELAALKRCIAELAVIGRNVNQLARVAQRNGQVTGPTRAEVLAMVQVCTTMHARFKELLMANLMSWESGYVEPK
ncbi:MAG: hypothetical protein AB7T07_09075 [Steroidobacteraceae bacterium]